MDGDDIYPADPPREPVLVWDWLQGWDELQANEDQLRWPRADLLQQGLN